MNRDRYGVPYAANEVAPLSVVSLFAGVGGFDLAFERAGAKVVAAVEIDAPARTVLAKRFPDTALFNDVTKVTGDELRAVGFVPERGAIVGGFPCQDLSVAGRREGLAGARSGLWWEFVRLLAELRPAWVVAENVPGLLSSDGGRDFGAVLGSLGELGYGFAYRILDAKYFGVPQQRRRVFIVGHLGEPFGAAAQVLFESESSDRDSAARSSAGPRVAAVAAECVATPSYSVRTANTGGNGWGVQEEVSPTLDAAAGGIAVVAGSSGTEHTQRQQPGTSWSSRVGGSVDR